MQHDNLFDLSLVLTHVDLRAVKANDSFHDKATGYGIAAFIGTKRLFGENSGGKIKSFIESADIYAEKIRAYAKKLQKSQPLLPVTKMPKASRVM